MSKEIVPIERVAHGISQTVTSLASLNFPEEVRAFTNGPT
jgi:hypothetical protein